MIVLIAGFVVYPVGSVFYYALQYDNLSKPWDNGFAGLGNFTRMLHDPVFYSSLRIALLWVLVEVALQLVVGLALALIVNESFRGRGLARALTFSPWAVSGVLTAVVWLLLYNPTTGFAQLWGNHTAAPLATHAFASAALAELWRGVPFFAIMLLADLQSIPRDLYEAASVDGASRWQRFRRITLPGLRDAVIISTLLRAVWEFNNVDLLYTLTNGGPAYQTTTLPLYVAKQAVVGQDFGYGSALTVAGFVVLLFLSVLYLRITKFNRAAA